MNSFYFWILVAPGSRKGQRGRQAAHIMQASHGTLALLQDCRVRVTFSRSRSRPVESENMSQGSLTGGGVGSCLCCDLPPPWDQNSPISWPVPGSSFLVKLKSTSPGRVLDLHRAISFPHRVPPTLTK